MQELVRTREELLQAVDGLSEEALRKTNEDGWSILHVLEHLHISEGRTTESIRRALASSEVHDIPEKHFDRFLDDTAKVKAPDVLQPSGKYSLAEVKELLSISRAKLKELVSSVEDPEALHTRGFEHPFFGLLSARQCMELVALHEGRHLRQIERMKQSL